MLKTLARLRQSKGAALDHMTELNSRCRAANRDLTETERLDYELQRSWVQELNSAIALLEPELESRGNLQQETPVTAAPARRQSFSEEDYFVNRDRDAPFLRLR